MTAGSDDPNHIERDLEHTRARLDATIDALQEKLSPGQVVDQAVTYFTESGGAEFGRNLMSSVRDNPMPVALVGVGLAWLMMSGSRRDHDEPARVAYRGRDYAPEYADDGPSAYAGYGDESYASAGYGTATGVDATSAGTEYTGESSSMAGGYGRSDYGTYPSAGTAYTDTGTQGSTGGYGGYEDLASRAHEAGSRLQRLENETSEAYEERVYTAKASVVGVSRSVGETFAAFRERVDHAIGAAGERFRQLGRQAANAASHLTGRGQAAAGGAYDYGRSTARGAYGYGQSAYAGMRDGADYAARRARDVGMRSVDYVQDRPLVLGALGLTVGAILGMLVPPTRYEREMLSGVRDTMRERAREAVREAGDRVARVAGEVVGTAQEASRREGLQVGDPRDHAAHLRDQVADVAHRARNVVEETAHAAREAVRREAAGETKEQSAGGGSGGGAVGTTGGTTGSSYGTTGGTTGTSTGTAGTGSSSQSGQHGQSRSVT